MAIKYDHLIVDEYQDCTVGQHQMIMSLSTILHTHILGDPLQGIFDFGREHIVDFPRNHLSCLTTIVNHWKYRGGGIMQEELL